MVVRVSLAILAMREGRLGWVFSFTSQGPSLRKGRGVVNRAPSLFLKG
jgi:hypothetical protein